MSVPKISIIINTLNEEKNLPQALSSIKGFADEVIVVDMNSEDKTREIAKDFGAKIFKHERVNYVEPARNFAIEKASGDWVFILDADEEAPKKLLHKLKEIVNTDEADFVRVPRKNIIFGNTMKHSRWWPDYNIRFFKKGSVTWENEIHSIPITIGKGINIDDKEELAIVHHNYNTVEQFIDRLNRYTSIQAEELSKKGKKFEFKYLLEKPTAEFVGRFFAGEGYKDGVSGLVVCLLQAFSELVVYIKLWQMDGSKNERISLTSVNEEISKSQKEINYWKAHSDVKETGKLTSKIKRKFKLT